MLGSAHSKGLLSGHFSVAVLTSRRHRSAGLTTYGFYGEDDLAVRALELSNLELGRVVAGRLLMAEQYAMSSGATTCYERGGPGASSTLCGCAVAKTMSRGQINPISR
jgi:hypothetical protein